MQPLPEIPLGNHAPDLPALNSPQGGQTAKNALPRLQSYGPLSDFLQIGTGPMSSRCLGVITTQQNDISGNVRVYGGDAADLYVFDGTSWVEKSQSVGGYNADRWEFVQWQGLVIAAHRGTIPQYSTLASGTVGSLDDFADLTTEDVRGRHIAIWRNFVVLGNVVDADGERASRVRWSGFNDPTTWEIDPVTLSDFQDLRGDFGPVQGLSSGTIGMVIMERGVWRAEFVGAPLVFRFDLADEKIGAIGPGWSIRYGDRTFFLSTDGFRAISVSGGPSVPIGEERVDRTVLAELALEYPEAVSAAIMDSEQVIVWSYPDGREGSFANRLVMYNMATDRWAEGDQVAERIWDHIGESLHIDNIDFIDGGAGEGLDNPAYGTFDGPQYRGSGRLLGVINNEHNLGILGGAEKKTASFVTREVQHTPGRRTAVHGVRPLVDQIGGSAEVRVRIAHRNHQSDPFTYTPPLQSPGKLVNSDGLAAFRVNDRYVSYMLEVSGGFGDAIGVEPYGRRAGRR